MRIVYRTASLLALASLALSAHAVDAYNNLDAAPFFYQSGGWVIGDGLTQGFQFTANASGILTGFQLAMNDYHATGLQDYTLQLYSNSSSNTLGNVLGTYSGTSTGINTFSTNSALSSVAAMGSSLSIVSGTSYWLVASSGSSLGWNMSNSTFGQRYVLVGGDGQYDQVQTAAFSVQVNPNVTSTPGPLAALPFALIAVKRRRRKA